MEKSLYSSDGRISRRDYWIRWAVTTAISVGLAVAAIASQGADGRPNPVLGGLDTIGSLILNLFMVIQGVKRMHDVDKSGWYILFPCYNLILACTAGTPGPNRFGADPLGPAPLEGLEKTFE